MNEQGRKALAFFVATAAIGITVVVFGTRVLGMAAGPESEIITLLKKTESTGFSLGVKDAAGALASVRHHFDRIVVESDPATRTAEAVSTLDFEGRLGATKVSSLGLETIRFEWREDAWRPRDGLAPRLSEITAVLERRRRALETGDLDSLAALARTSPEAVRADPELAWVLEVRNRRYRVEGWYLRSERDEVLVGEDWRLEGETPSRPVDEKGTRRLILRRDDAGFFFEAGLM